MLNFLCFMGKQLYQDRYFVLTVIGTMIYITYKINTEISQSISRDIEQLFINHLTNNEKIKINENLLNSLFQNDS